MLNWLGLQRMNVSYIAKIDTIETKDMFSRNMT